MESFLEMEVLESFLGTELLESFLEEVFDAFLETEVLEAFLETEVFEAFLETEVFEAFLVVEELEALLVTEVVEDCLLTVFSSAGWADFISGSFLDSSPRDRAFSARIIRFTFSISSTLEGTKFSRLDLERLLSPDVVLD